MKYLVVSVAVLVLGWFGFMRYLANRAAEAERIAAAASVASPIKTPPSSAAPAPSVAVAPSPVAAPPAASPAVNQASALVLSPAPTRGVPNPNAPIPIDLAQALDANNRYTDAAVGLSATFPEGWKVVRAIRWGEGHLQNTVHLRPDVPSSASPSMYYKPYTVEEAASIASTGAQTLLREQAQKKEASRVGGMRDYQNVPDSFHFFDVDGSPAMTYFATFTRGDQVMTEHFIRVLGPKGYVMFFTTGRFEDVKAIMPQLKQAASSVKGP